MRALALVMLLSGCLGPQLSAVDRKLSEADRYILNQCANLDDPVNAARIDALALITTSTQTVEAGRERRKAYCEFKRKQTEGLTNDE